MNDWNGKLVYVMGLGRFGGGIGVVRYLASQGALLRIGDLSDKDSLSDSISQIQELLEHQSAELRLGEHQIDDLEGVDVLVVNPAVPLPWKNAFIREAKRQGIAITTEIEIVYRSLDPSRVIAVTGSAGKSTTSAMIHHALTQLGYHSKLGGNIGGSLLKDLESITQQTWVVLELSSAMLYWLGESKVFDTSPPAIGVVTNCISNHLDWHGDAAHYERSKRLLAAAANHVVLGEQVSHWSNGNCVVIPQSDAVQSCSLPGAHNGLNAAVASRAVSLATGADLQTARNAAGSFPGLPHRLQLVCEIDGVRYYNDSKCTVPDATLLAIEAVSELVNKGCIHLIAGGYDKGSDLSSIAHQAPLLAGLYTIGSTGKNISDSAVSNAFDCGDLRAAMNCLESRVKAGDAVLLSPGCASWDQFENYQARGEQFAQLAQSSKRSVV